ncbi:amidase [Cupriavidus gilardii]
MSKACLDAAVMTASEAAALIRSGRLRAEDLVRACLDRIEAREPVVGAWTWLDPDAALAAAREADRSAPRGALHGVPIGVKDIIDTCDMPTGLGFPPYADRRPSWDAACVAACRRAGAIVLGKTVTTEFAYFAAGKTRHPRDRLVTPGGSSSGSAAAVADGMVPLALGSQTAGSLIRPAAYCGVVGYKASHGEFSLAGIRPFAESLDSLGILARSLEDVTLMRQVLLGRCQPAVAPVAGTAPPRLALCRTPHWEKMETAAREAVQDAVARLRAAGASVDTVELPAALAGAEDAQYAVMAHEAWRNYPFEYERYPLQTSAAFRRLCEAGESVSPAAYRAALARIGEARAAFARLFAGYQAWLVPSALGEAPPAADGTGDPIMSRLWTALHAPCVALPHGSGPRGLPLGIQLVAPKGGDAPLLDVSAWAARYLVPG